MLRTYRPEQQLLEGRVMIQIAPQMCILVVVEAVDFRKGIDGLACVW